MLIPTKLCVALLLILLFSSIARGQTEISGDGIIFPDDTIQTTAATSASGWPQQCYGSVSANEILYIACSLQGGGSDPAWDSINGVPEGYFFLVTDVLITPVTFADTTEIWIQISHVTDCDNGILGGTGTILVRANFKQIPDSRTLSAHFQSPLMILSEGHCIKLSGISGNTDDASFNVSGYLVTDPSKFRY